MNKMRLAVKGEGQIRQMSLPDGWIEVEKDPRPDTVHVKEFECPENSETRIMFYYRGRRVDTTTGDNFVRILSIPDHELSEQEFSDIVVILNNASEPDNFEVSSCRTETINGKRVLMLEGIWKDGGVLNLGMFIDSDNTGTAVQEVHYLAPESHYATYIEEIEQAIGAIVWK